MIRELAKQLPDLNEYRPLIGLAPFPGTKAYREQERDAFLERFERNYPRNIYDGNRTQLAMTDASCSMPLDACTPVAIQYITPLSQQLRTMQADVRVVKKELFTINHVPLYKRILVGLGLAFLSASTARYWINKVEDYMHGGKIGPARTVATRSIASSKTDAYPQTLEHLLLFEPSLSEGVSQNSSPLTFSAEQQPPLTDDPLALLVPSTAPELPLHE